MEKKRPLKIAFISPMFFPSVGGIEINMLNLGRALTEKGYHIKVLTTNLVNGRPMNLPEVDFIDGIQVHRFNVSTIRSLQKFAFAPSIIGYLLTSDIDVIHIFSYLPYFFTNMAWLVSWIRGIEAFYTPTYHPERKVLYSGVLKILMPFFDILGLIMLRSSQMVLGLTEGETKYYSKFGIKATTLPPALEFTYQKFEDVEVEKFRSRFNLKKNVLLYVGRLERKKGIHHLIRSFIKVLKKIPKTSLLIVGRKNGNYRYLKKLSEELGCANSVVFTGYLNKLDLIYAYSAAEIVISPSKFETFGHTILESWAHKKAVIAVDSGGPRELVNSNVGMLTSYGDEDQLSDAIIHILENHELRQNMGENGYLKLRKLYNFKDIINKLTSIYSELQ